MADSRNSPSVFSHITNMSELRFSPVELSGTMNDADDDILGMELPFLHAEHPEEAAVLPTLPLKRLGARSAPRDVWLNSSTGLVHGRIVVEHRNRFSKSPVHFCLQDANGEDDFSLYLVAVKEKNRYNLYDASKIGESWDFLGEMKRAEFHNDSVSYELTSKGQLDACIFFNKPNLIQYAFEGAPRQLELGVLTKEGRKLDLEQAYQVVKDCCKFSESKAQTSAYKIVGDSRFLSVFQSAMPYRKAGLKKFGLNFQGRGRGASTKNCQMLSENGQHSLQMAKFDKGVYHVDFCAPLSAYQTFAFALAQLDL